MLYVYHRDGLRKMLFDEDVRNFLYQCGYRYGSVSEAIGQLKKRMSGEFPHEIGVFLGYPLCDVCGFMRDPDGCLFCGVWKVYDNEEQAKRTFEKFRRCSDCICRHMQRGKSLVQIFNVN